MEPIRPVGAASSDFDRWIERRRRQLRSQLTAIEDQRWDDLAGLLDEDPADEPPGGADGQDREAYRVLLLEAEQVAQRLAEVRRKALKELRDTDPERLAPPREQPHGRLGDRLDGYL